MDGIARLDRGELGTGGMRITTEEVFSFPVHSHDYCEMTLYRPFDGCVYVNQHRIDMSGPGATVVLVTQSDFHRISVADDCGSRYIKISFDSLVVPQASRSLLSEALYVRGIEEDSLELRLFEEVLAAQEDVAYCAALIGAVLMRLNRTGTRLEDVHGGRRRELALNAVRIVNDRYNEPLTLSGVAEELSVSPQHLSTVFSGTMGIGFSDYLTGLRLRRAAELLRETDLSVTEVCFRCGYGNLSHFLRCFRNRFGTTPLRYKNIR